MSGDWGRECLSSFAGLPLRELRDRIDDEGDFGRAHAGTLAGYRWLEPAGGRSSLGSAAVALRPSEESMYALCAVLAYSVLFGMNRSETRKDQHSHQGTCSEMKLITYKRNQKIQDICYICLTNNTVQWHTC